MSQINTAESMFVNLSNLLMRKYLPSVIETVSVIGTPTMRRIKPSSKVATQKENVERFITAQADSARLNDSMLDDFGQPEYMEDATLTYRYDPVNAATNDFRAIDATARVTLAEMLSPNAEGLINIAQRVTKEVFRGLNETPSTMIHSDGNGQIGKVNGTKVALTADYANGSAYSNGSKEATFAMDGYSIGVFRPGAVVDLYNGDTLVASHIKVRHVDYNQGALSAEVTSRSNVANLDGIVDNLSIFRSGERGKGFKTSFGEVFKQTIATDDSWVGGVNRSKIENMHLIPLMLRRNVTTKEIASQDHLDQMAMALGYEATGSKTAPLSAFGGDSLIQSVRNSIANESLSINSATDNANHKFGNSSVRYVHPSTGEIELVGDKTALNDRLLFLDTKDVEMFYGGSKGINVLTSGQGHGLFERMEGTNSHRGGSKVFKLEATTMQTPKLNGLNKMAAVFGLTG